MVSSVQTARVLTGAGAKLDPRTKLFTLITVNALVFGASTDLVITAALTLAVVLLAASGKWRAVLGFVVAAGLFQLAAGLPQLLGASTFMAFFIAFCYWMKRFIAIGAIVYWAFSTTRVGHFSAAMGALHCPRTVLVPLAVMLRFIPTVIAECRAIVDAMRLRGVMPTGMSALLHPMRTSEYLLVPLLASCTRISDDMTASALVRGLGLPVRPTTVTALRFGVADLLLLAAVAALVALHWYEADWSHLHDVFFR